MPDLSYEKECWKKGEIVAGCDEAGRGPLAGPVYAAAVSITPEFIIFDGIDDSKKLTPKSRDELFSKIISSENLSYAISHKTNSYIDEHNILKSSIDAMNDSAHNLEQQPDHLLVDGNRFSGEFAYTTIVKGDSKSISIALASILAKVTRDRFMEEIDKELPKYGFAKHKGYPTKFHFEAIAKFGTTKYHRKTFLRKFYKRQLELFQ